MLVLEQILERWGYDAAIARILDVRRTNGHKAMCMYASSVDSPALVGSILKHLTVPQERSDLLTSYLAVNTPLTGGAGLVKWVRGVSADILVGDPQAIETYCEFYIPQESANMFYNLEGVTIPDKYTQAITDIFMSRSTWYYKYSFSLNHPQYRPAFIPALQQRSRIMEGTIRGNVKESARVRLKQLPDTADDMWEFINQIGLTGIKEEVMIRTKTDECLAVAKRAVTKPDTMHFALANSRERWGSCDYFHPDWVFAEVCKKAFTADTYPAEMAKMLPIPELELG